MRVVKKQYCDRCKQDVDVNVVGDATDESIPCICSRCGNPIEVTKDQVLTQWRKVLFEDTSRRIINNDNK